MKNKEFCLYTAKGHTPITVFSCLETHLIWTIFALGVCFLHSLSHTCYSFDNFSRNYKHTFLRTHAFKSLHFVAAYLGIALMPFILEDLWMPGSSYSPQSTHPVQADFQTRKGAINWPSLCFFFTGQGWCQRHTSKTRASWVACHTLS